MEKFSIGIITNDIKADSLLVSYASDHGHAVSLIGTNSNAYPTKEILSIFSKDVSTTKDALESGKVYSAMIVEDTNVDTMALRQLRKEGACIYPQPEVIDIIRNRCVLKRFLEHNDIPIVHAYGISSRQDVYEHIGSLPVYLKKCNRRGDKDIYLVNDIFDLEHIADDNYILEECVAVQQEFSVLISRNEFGKIECYSPIWMAFDEEQVLMDFRLCPDNITPEQAMEAGQIAIKIVNACNAVGLLAIDMFITNENKLLVNDVKLGIQCSPFKNGPIPAFEQRARHILGLTKKEKSVAPEHLTFDLIEPAAAKRDCMAQALKTILCLPHRHLTKAKNRILDTSVEQNLLKAVMIRYILTNNTSASNAL